MRTRRAQRATEENFVWDLRNSKNVAKPESEDSDDILNDSKDHYQRYTSIDGKINEKNAEHEEDLSSDRRRRSSLLDAKIDN